MLGQVTVYVCGRSSVAGSVFFSSLLMCAMQIIHRKQDREWTPVSDHGTMDRRYKSKQWNTIKKFL